VTYGAVGASSLADILLACINGSGYVSQSRVLSTKLFCIVLFTSVSNKLPRLLTRVRHAHSQDIVNPGCQILVSLPTFDGWRLAMQPSPGLGLDDVFIPQRSPIPVRKGRRENDLSGGVIFPWGVVAVLTQRVRFSETICATGAC